MRDLLSVSTIIADIALPLPMAQLFSYVLPPELIPSAKVGTRVRVPFKNRELIGYLVGIKEEVPENILKPVLSILDPEPLLSPPMLALTHWVSEYYASSWGEAIENAMPRWIKYGKKAEKYLARHADDGPATENVFVRNQHHLTADQQKTLDLIVQSAKEKQPKPILIHGVTGSGKSEIYIRTIHEIINKGKSAICLVPEIALTEQLRRFFADHFGDNLEMIHSKMSDGERYLAWKRLSGGQTNVVLGPRSAVFSPVQNLGLIIIDEEHEGSYKQETTPRYHAREVAAWRCQNEGAVFVMGTATPSLESMYRAKKDEYQLVTLDKRIEEKPMPPVHVVDLKQVMSNRKQASIFSPQLVTEIENNLKNKQGTILLLNRRGFSTVIQCTKCGHSEICESCQVSLTYHQEDDSLLCHYCNFHKPVPQKCANCQLPVLKFGGYGTEKVESLIAQQFPTARIGRLDADTTRQKGSHETILKSFREEKIDILIGTQMIAKGFDFPHVTLVGVILADVGLSLPDLRSAERTFQLLTQVAGRAGRGKIPGRVFIQTFSPEHPSVRYSRNHDYQNFYQYEISQRYQYRYPPNFQLINIILRARDEKKAYLFGRSMKELLDQVLQSQIADKKVEIMGPAPLPFYKLRGHFRWHIMLKIEPGTLAAALIAKPLSMLKKPSDVNYVIDVDPLNIL